jgi:hypothetical protein
MIYRVLHNKKGREKSLPNFELFPRIDCAALVFPLLLPQGRFPED